MNIQDAMGTGQTATDAVAAYNYFLVAALAMIVANAWDTAFQRLISPHRRWAAFAYAAMATVVAVVVVVVVKRISRSELRSLTSEMRQKS